MQRRQIILGLKLALGLLLALSALFVTAGGAAGAGGTGGFVVVVNAANPTSSLSAEEVSRMFLKKTPHWANGERVVAIDLSDTSPVRESFSQQIHGRPASAVKAYWQKMIFSGRDVPPVEKTSGEEALAFVRGNAGAIAYVAAGTPLGSGVKILTVK
jgi:ABC-type phosphate transport system substrate-binding protein